MLIRKLSIAAALVALVAATTITPSAIAQDDPIAERKEAMKVMGGAMRTLVPMARGQADYDAEAALAAFVRMNDAAQNYGELFPEGSETGGDTRARPEIWTDRAGFDQAVDDFKVDLAAAVDAAPADAATFGPVFGAVAQNCGACHERFQVPEG